MGRKDKSKKGKGAEKTHAKTVRNLSSKMKKTLKDLGEDDIENVLAQIEEEEKKRLRVIECHVEPPSRRVNFSFVSHPDKDQLILYGGEYFNGQTTSVYSELFFYNIPNNTWTLVKAPAGPPPRCGHQMVTTSANKGQLWVFGGEFASPSQSQFYHYKDLWVYSISDKQWKKVTAPEGPSARSGHRMVLVKKQLLVFGGYHDNSMDYKYFNDVHSFDLETYKWKKIVPVGTPPAPRSGCCMVPLQDGRVLIYGGYSKEKVKKDVDKGHVYTDAFVLGLDKHDATKTKYKWQQVKLGSQHFSPRCSMPVVTAMNGQSAYFYGGVFDIEKDEEDISSHFFNDFLQLDLNQMAWRQLELTGKKDLKSKRRRNKEDGSGEEVADNGDSEASAKQEQPIVVSDDGVFKVTMAPKVHANIQSSGQDLTDKSTLFQPSPRMNCGLAIKQGILYLYGGMFEDGERELTFSDLYSIDVRKLDEWKTIIEDDSSQMEWLGSESDSESEEEDDDSDSSSEMETD